MPTYESVFAVPASRGGEERTGFVKETEKLISDNGGEIISSQEMGEKEMAYRVKGTTRAYYHLLNFRAPTKAYNVLNDHYRFNDPYIRSLIIKKDPEKEA